MSEPVLEATGLSKSYGKGERWIEVLTGLDMTVGRGESVAVIGDSGVGKSTLLHILGGLDRPEAGSMHCRGMNVFSLDGPALAAFRNRVVGFVFQFHYLLPEFTALENVAIPSRIAGEEDGEDRARGMLERLGLADRWNHYPGELSGGEQQRVAIARAVARDPALVLADEPTGNLDPGTGAAVFDLLLEIQAESSFGLVLATHSGRLARGCDRTLRLRQGTLEAITPAEISRFFEGSPAPEGRTGPQ